MRSPFPGMDPYLEQQWLAVHNALIAESWRILNRRLPDGFVATMEERVSVDADNQPSRRLGLHVLIEHGPPWRTSVDEGTVTVDAPFRMV